ncbi:helix-turn-helix transcriptional regulator [Seonamhaeicola algicola]|uniref:Helix-turn-helix transcriptional regulator n=1 Tax=Seonamhaeicola algicola TaxID=1719036 RepID=A0A5C7B5L8_9FLAO|nr:AraC family transcriptional regulator [Seonamhaeicola algicola]TXE13152.1 helix-turn-helix transcriptional regulator [Seonamhaeicola algicola]
MKPVLEHIKLGEKRSILAYKYSGEDFDAPWHFHPQHELTFITKSTGTKFIGDYVGSYQPGELVLLRSYLPHCWKNLQEQNEMPESIVIQWNKGIYNRVPELEALFNMLRAASRGILFSKDTVKALKPKIEALLHLEGQALYLNLLELLLALAACDFTYLSNASFEDDIPTEYGSRMSKIHDFIEANYQRKIFLKELAELVSMSEYSFSRFFSKMMGRPFFTFLNEYRINIASRMLIDTDWSVAQIGYACGYESLTFFHKQFKKVKHVTPKKYRSKHKA